MRYSKDLPILVGITVCLFSLYFIQHHIHFYKDGRDAVKQDLMLLPEAEYLKPLMMGYDQLAADIVWLRAIQVIGEDTNTPEQYEWIYHALDVVTTLDPKFSYAYEVGGIILSVLGKQPGLSNLLLNKGAQENPEIWKFPFYIGFNDFFYLKDYSSAAFYMARASKLPGRPAYLPKLAARLYVQAGKPGTALVFLDGMIRETKDEKIRKALRERVREIKGGRLTFHVDGH